MPVKVTTTTDSVANKSQNADVIAEEALMETADSGIIVDDAAAQTEPLRRSRSLSRTSRTSSVCIILEFHLY